MPATFREADEVRQIASQLIPRFHEHLVEARIGYLFRQADQEWKSGGKRVWGRAYKVPARERHYTELDFVIVIDESTWLFLAAEKRRALVDHELAHCGQGEPDKQGNARWVLWAHDVEDFAAVLERHGLWTSDVKQFAEVAARKLQQVTFDEVAAAQTAEAAQPPASPAEPALGNLDAAAAGR